MGNKASRIADWDGERGRRWSTNGIETNMEETDQSAALSSDTMDKEEVIICPGTSERLWNIISGLPMDTSWRAPSPIHLYQGFWSPPHFLESIILAQENFHPKPDDIFVCTATKSGTNWIKALTFSIVTRTRFDSSTSPLLSRLPHECFPSLEFGKKPGFRELGIPLVHTHIPYLSLPESVRNSDCKIVYMCREPKDAFVSLFHFAAKLRPKDYEPISLEDAFELHCSGKSWLGPFWDHILGYWKANLENPGRVLFLKYEDVMKDPVTNVRKLAEFMGYPFSAEEEEQGTVEKVVEMCSFEFLSNLEVNKKGRTENLGFENKAFFRKGKVGDWKHHLTPEMAERLNKIVEEKLGAFGLTFDV